MPGLPRIDRADVEPQDETALKVFGGEFCAPALERDFIAGQASEIIRHARLSLLASVLLNSLFLISDWRFLGTDHFWVAVPARLMVVAVSALCLLLVMQHPRPAAIERIMIGWMAVTSLAVGALVTSHSDIALFVVILLPSIFYLVMPVAFRWTVICGVSCSACMIVGYALGNDQLMVSFGLSLAMLVLNTALGIVVTRQNRLARQTWLATRAERHSREALSASRAMFEQLFAASPVPIVVAARADGRILKCNDAWVAQIGLSAEESMQHTLHSFYSRGQDRDKVLALVDRDGSVEDFEIDLQRPDGTTLTVSMRSRLINIDDMPVIVSGLVDISTRKAAERSLERLASTDMLTGLPNRLSFFTAGQAEMTRATRTGAPLSLMMIDLDHFKSINDAHGHHGGDQVLRGFAEVCRTMLTGKDIIGRLGGEEFAVLLPNSDGPRALAAAEQLRYAVQEMRLAAPYDTLAITVSIGLTRVLPRERNIELALARADGALYAAKREGRNRVVASRLQDIGQRGVG